MAKKKVNISPQKMENNKDRAYIRERKRLEKLIAEFDQKGITKYQKMNKEQLIAKLNKLDEDYSLAKAVSLREPTPDQIKNYLANHPAMERTLIENLVKRAARDSKDYLALVKIIGEYGNAANEKPASDSVNIVLKIDE